MVLILYVSLNGFEEKTIKRQFTQKVFTRKISSVEGNLKHSRQMYRTLMFAVCISVALLLLVQLSTQQVLIFRAISDPSSLQLALKYIYGLQIVLGYVFMWIRQRLFYYGSSPIRNLLSEKSPLLFLSSFSLVFVFINVVVQLSLAWYWDACSILYEALVWFILCLFVQGTLIGLFLYPLWKLNRESERYMRSTNGNGRGFSSGGDNVKNLIRRCVFISFFYFATDLGFTLAIIITEAREESFSELFMMLIQNINAVVNIACLLCSFRNWVTIMMPWKKISRLRKQTTTLRRTNSSPSQRRNTTELSES